ncbi:MAG: VOC family protein [Pseudomonadota bacterium]
MRLHHIALRTHRVDEVVAFYRDLLALPVVRAQAGRSVWLGLETSVLMVENATADEPGIPPGSGELLAFAVDAATQERIELALRACAVAIEDRTDFTVYFRDPDGRRVGVSTYPLPELKAST